ncbi:O-antigen ligase family protein [Bacteroides uniformis]|uniref:O-antigen ligase family protein n=1 Tax=Bacteroides uniformis TaxID=820 RepID=UPI00125DB9A0|nr:O-antigen ligase family protein [Bacteroides uniformis]KAB3872982.1 O-antigen ligase family protein [Bacteroides uniformis]KAB3889985.1 O-antigen ligase family protein [Bacteroides uniformis]KAB3891078.1 O-antigen ligase family protein [Bacteroides uniformis]KAB3891836.1 O-antigen ligase family protein [Bacteroides uniformis]KAB3902020.1 O-antigen ligase family protein [Bacteroides uniformis]
MLKYLKDISSGFFILVVAFSYSIYFVIATFLGIPQEGVVFRLYSGILAVVVAFVFFLSIHRIPRRIYIGGLLLCAIIILLYFSTRCFYDEVNNRYTSYFLSMEVRFIPAVLTGMYMLSHDDIMKKVEYALLPFILLYTITLASVAFTANIGVNIAQTFNTDFLNYQSISYYSIFAFGFNMYLIVQCSNSYTRYRRYILIALAILQVIITIMAGGRGAFVLGCVFTLYFALKHITFSKLISYILIGLAVLLTINAILSDNEIFKMGFERIFNFFGNTEAIGTDNRWIRWNLAWNAFTKSPVFGHGLGSVFYEVGFYSHNIFTDMLCEGGVVLFLIFIFVLMKFIRASQILITEDYRNEIIVIVFLCSFVMNSFSGYYLSDTGIWLSLTYVLCKNSLNNRLY